MKEIVIYQEHVDPIILGDEDDRKLEDYSTALSAILENTNIVILHLSTGSFIIRPNKISSMFVREVTPSSQEADEVEPTTKEESEITELAVEPQEEVIEDIITD